MKKVILILGFINSSYGILAQKPSIDSTLYGKWQFPLPIAISNNGKFISYVIQEQSLKLVSSIVQSSNTGWKLEIYNASPIQFAEDNNHAFFIKGEDSLGIITLGKSVIQYISHVKSFKLTGKEDNEWITYISNDSTKELFAKNLGAGKALSFKYVKQYLFSSDNKILLLLTELKEGDSIIQSLIWVSLLDGNKNTIWKGTDAVKFSFDNNSKQLAFIAGDSGQTQKDYAIWYYKKGMGKAEIWATTTSRGMEKGFSISNKRLSFTKDGKRLLFVLHKVTPITITKTSPDLADVYVWNYKDKYLQSEQLRASLTGFVQRKEQFLAMGTLDEKTVTRLENENDRVPPTGNDLIGDYIIFFEKEMPTDWYKSEIKDLTYLVSLKDGSRKGLPGRDVARLSPDEHYVIWFDDTQLCYFSYEIATGLTKNISQKILSPIYDKEAALLNRHSNFGIAGWLENDKSILIYDHYDIWQVDPKGVNSPVNITDGYGEKHHIVFGIASIEKIIYEESILLTGYDDSNKDNGFWVVRMNSGKEPEKRTMGPYIYNVSRTGIANFQIDVYYPGGIIPLKAKDANYWIVARRNAMEPSNLFVTTDFTTFSQISNLRPERKYNWLTAELIKWKMADGRVSQGILYKPEDFDSTKKYPIIFNYYGKRSDGLNEFMAPNYSNAEIDIPSYVSSGYLVFVPDIYYKRGHAGEGVINSVVPAAKYLCSFPWVDSSKMGIQGHSFGGWETNFLITHCHIFAAACEAAGVSDQVSAYDYLTGDGASRQKLYEQTSQGAPYGIGVTPWSKPELYVENSPIFYLSKVTTPLLIMHGRIDGSVPFDQSIEFFTGLRRAGKKVWLLEYASGGHTLRNVKDAKDFTIRLRQFFDYYLKGSPPPKWMTEGVLASNKGIDSGLEIDLSGKQP